MPRAVLAKFVIAACAVAVALPAANADAARSRAWRPAPAVRAPTADDTLAWGRRYLDFGSWTLRGNSAGVLMFVRAMTPPQPGVLWVRYEHRYPTQIDGFTYRSMIQRLRVNCASGEYRREDIYYFRDNDRAGPSRRERPRAEDWETPLPDSLIEAAVAWQCRPEPRRAPGDPADHADK
jgi:hypothetical protein